MDERYHERSGWGYPPAYPPGYPGGVPYGSPVPTREDKDRELFQQVKISLVMELIDILSRRWATVPIHTPPEIGRVPDVENAPSEARVNAIMAKLSLFISDPTILPMINRFFGPNMDMRWIGEFLALIKKELGNDRFTAPYNFTGYNYLALASSPKPDRDRPKYQPPSETIDLGEGQNDPTSKGKKESKKEG